MNYDILTDTCVLTCICNVVHNYKWRKTVDGDILVQTYALYPLWIVPRVKMQHWRLTICIVWTLHPALGVKAPQIILHTLRRCAIDVSPIKSIASNTLCSSFSKKLLYKCIIV